MSLAAEVHAIRNSAGWSRADHVVLLYVDGPEALDFLQGATTQSPYAREGRIRHTLFLREDGSVLADVLVVKVEEAFFVLAEGPSEKDLIDWLEALKVRTSKQANIRGLGREFAILGIDGPYAWEVMAGVFGPVVLGMPYLSLMRREDALCVRAGKTGEYGYLVLVPRASIEAFETRLAEVGAPLDLARVSVEALDVCGLESWHFSIRSIRERSSRRLLTPIELQLQWRVGYTREFIGAEALRAHRKAPNLQRATCFLAEKPIAPGTRVMLDAIDVGEVLAACVSPTLGVTVGSALLDRRFAHPHLSLRTAEGLALRTQTASLVQNVSLRVQPHKSSYATRNAPVTA